MQKSRMTSRDTGGLSRGWFRIESSCREQFPPWLRASAYTAASQRVPRSSGRGRAAHVTEGVERDSLPGRAQRLRDTMQQQKHAQRRSTYHWIMLGCVLSVGFWIADSAIEVWLCGEHS